MSDRRFQRAREDMERHEQIAQLRADLSREQQAREKAERDAERWEGVSKGLAGSHAEMRERAERAEAERDDWKARAESINGQINEAYAQGVSDAPGMDRDLNALLKKKLAEVEAQAAWMRSGFLPSEGAYHVLVGIARDFSRSDAGSRVLAVVEAAREVTANAARCVNKGSYDADFGAALLHLGDTLGALDGKAPSP